MNRRSLLEKLLAGGAGAVPLLQEARARAGGSATLKSLAQQKGKMLGMFTVAHELRTSQQAAQIIASEFSLIADGNDLKFANRLSPTPTTYNFKEGDFAVEWAARNGLLFRGHNLLWHKALPDWFSSYVNKNNAERVMTDHITTVVKHYSGKIYAWDVVNEVFHNDGRPDGLRRKPWLDWIGPEYIDIAFRTAAAADPKAKLILNETNLEHVYPDQQVRRDSLLKLVTTLKNNGVPIAGIGIQGHLEAKIPLATAGLKSLLTALQQLGLEIMITEMDVDDSGVPAADVDAKVAHHYAEFLDTVLPFVTGITFEQLADDPSLPKRSDGLPHQPNLFNENYQKKSAYNAVAQSLAQR